MVNVSQNHVAPNGPKLQEDFKAMTKEELRNLEAKKKKNLQCASLQSANYEYDEAIVIKSANIVGVQQINRVFEAVEETLKGQKTRLLNHKTLPILKLWALISCYGNIRMIDGQDTLAYWVSGRFPLMKVSSLNNTSWARCFEGDGNIRYPKLYHMPFNLLIDYRCCISFN